MLWVHLHKHQNRLFVVEIPNSSGAAPVCRLREWNSLCLWLFRIVRGGLPGWKHGRHLWRSRCDRFTRQALACISDLHLCCSVITAGLPCTVICVFAMSFSVFILILVAWKGWYLEVLCWTSLNPGAYWIYSTRSPHLLLHIPPNEPPAESMTVEKYIDACNLSGYTTAGLEWGQWVLEFVLTYFTQTILLGYILGNAVSNFIKIPIVLCS